MSLIAIFILFFIKHSASECVLHTEPSDRQFEVKLHKDVFFNDNNYLVIPNKNGTTVTIKFILKNFKFDENEELFGIYSWMFFHWEDPRIQWNASDYGGVDKTIIHSVNLWTPLGILNNVGDVTEYGGEYFHYTYCQVDNTGKVLCVLRVIFYTMCIAKLDDWPYDSQTCTFNFGIKKSNRDNVTFTFNQGRGISALGAEYGSGWDIVDYAVGENATDAIKFNLTFVVERHATGLASLVVFPLVIVSTMTVSSMFLDVRNAARLSFLTLSLYAHFNFLQTIDDNIPRHGSNSPTVLFFIRSSIIITIFSIILTFILNLITKRTWKCYLWIDLINDYVLKSRMSFAIQPKWQVANTEVEPSHVGAWTDFASIVNSFFIFIIVITYINIYFIYMPQPIPINKEYNI